MVWGGLWAQPGHGTDGSCHAGKNLLSKCQNSPSSWEVVAAPAPSPGSSWGGRGGLGGQGSQHGSGSGTRLLQLQSHRR